MPGPSVSVWRFVDRPEIGATVLLNMHNPAAGWKVSREDFDVSPPPLKRSIASNAMTDGGVVTSASYELRELKFTLELSAESEDWRAAQLKQLEAELAKPANLIMYQPRDNSYPVFFRTLRSDAFDLDNQYIPGKVWKVPLSVLAEPFAIGTRHDVTSGLVVTNDPASGTNPTRFDITGVRGDHPSPAFVRIAALGAGGTAILAQRTANNPTALTVFAQAEGGTLGTDAFNDFAGGAAWSGSGNNLVYVTWATSTALVTRLTVTVPTASSSEALRGRYRVYLRCSHANAGAVLTLRYRQNPGAGMNVVNGPQVTFTVDNTTPRFVDLGVIEFPSFAAPVAPGYSNLPAGYATSALAIQVQRVSGGGNFNMDYVYLLPADERMCAVNQVTAAAFAILDGPNDMTYGMASGTTPFGATRTVDNAGGLIPRIGGLPMLVPGISNRWYMLVDRADPATTKTVDVSYWPRWREVATS